IVHRRRLGINRAVRRIAVGDGLCDPGCLSASAHHDCGDRARKYRFEMAAMLHEHWPLLIGLTNKFQWSGQLSMPLGRIESLNVDPPADLVALRVDLAAGALKDLKLGRLEKIVDHAPQMAAHGFARRLRVAFPQGFQYRLVLIDPRI